MLEHLFGSKTRVKLLTLFLRHPDEQLFVREITRLVGTQINAVRRELSNLVQFGLIREVTAEPETPEEQRRPGLRRKYYTVDKSFLLLPEISSLIVKAQVLLEQRLDKEILKMGEIRYLALLGAFLGKTAGPVDVFVVGNIDQKAMQHLMHETEKELGFEINFSVMTPEEFHYRKDITDRFLYAILEAPKNVVVDRLNDKLVL